jgi:hypothetical protein
MPIRSRMLALSGPRRTDRGNGGRPAGTFCAARGCAEIPWSLTDARARPPGFGLALVLAERDDKGDVRFGPSLRPQWATIPTRRSWASPPEHLIGAGHRLWRHTFQ